MPASTPASNRLWNDDVGQAIEPTCLEADRTASIRLDHRKVYDKMGGM
jgi:hypothetical protein